VIAWCVAAISATVPERITVVERATSDTVIPTAGANDKFGNALVFANDVYDEANATKVGSDQGSCVRTVVGAAGRWECWWSLTLADGSITVQGPFSDTDDTVLAITGGTGAYRFAQGEMQLNHVLGAATVFQFVYQFSGPGPVSSIVGSSTSSSVAIWAVFGAAVIVLLASWFCYRRNRASSAAADEERPLNPGR